MWFKKLKCSCSFCFYTLKTLPPKAALGNVKHQLWRHMDLGLNLGPASFYCCDSRQVTFHMPLSLKKGGDDNRAVRKF